MSHGLHSKADFTQTYLSGRAEPKSCSVGVGRPTQVMESAGLEPSGAGWDREGWCSPWACGAGEALAAGQAGLEVLPARRREVATQWRFQVGQR